MKPTWSYCLMVLLPAVAACTTTGAGDPGRPAHTVEAVGKVVDSLAEEATRRAGVDAYRGLPVVVSPSGQAANAVELIVAEFLRRSLGEREREAERAAARTTGLLVTFAARDGDRYAARSHVVAIVSASSGDVALEQK
jgi:hypothetical protein